MALGPVMVNGYLADSNSAHVRMDGDVTYGITKVDWDVTRESKTVQQIGTTTPVGGTVGSGKFSLTTTHVFDYWQELKGKMAARGPYMQVAVDVLVTQSPMSDGLSKGLDTRQESNFTFQRCTVSSVKSSIAAGGEAQVVDVTWDVRGMVEDGAEAFSGADLNNLSALGLG